MLLLFPQILPTIAATVFLCFAFLHSAASERVAGFEWKYRPPLHFFPHQIAYAEFAGIDFLSYQRRFFFRRIFFAYLPHPTDRPLLFPEALTSWLLPLLPAFAKIQLNHQWFSIDRLLFPKILLGWFLSL